MTSKIQFLLSLIIFGTIGVFVNWLLKNQVAMKYEPLKERYAKIKDARFSTHRNLAPFIK